MKQLFPRVRMKEEKKQMARSERETAQDWESCGKDKKRLKDVDETREPQMLEKPGQQPGAPVDRTPLSSSRPYNVRSDERAVAEQQACVKEMNKRTLSHVDSRAQQRPSSWSGSSTPRPCCRRVRKAVTQHASKHEVCWSTMWSPPRSTICALGHLTGRPR